MPPHLSPSGASSVIKSIESSFSFVGDILRAVSILKSADGGSGDYLENLSSSFLALILLERLEEEGIKAAIFSEKEILDNPAVIRGYKAVIVAGRLTYCDDDRDASGREREEEGWGEYSAALIARALSSGVDILEPEITSVLCKPQGCSKCPHNQESLICRGD